MNPEEQAQFIAVLAAILYSSAKSNATEAVAGAVAIYTAAVASVEKTPLPEPTASSDAARGEQV